MKTLQEIKDEVAKDMGYHDYKTAWSMFESGVISAYSFQDFQQELMYQAAKEALKNASENAYILTTRGAGYRYNEVSKRSILDENNIPKI